MKIHEYNQMLKWLTRPKAKINEIGFPDKDLMIMDDVGKLWYVNEEDVKLCQN